MLKTHLKIKNKQIEQSIEKYLINSSYTLISINILLWNMFVQKFYLNSDIPENFHGMHQNN